jgi:sterol desaturase/sphingolipid hydroxylase (fatty acid hydroxylase superfamily)
MNWSAMTFEVLPRPKGPQGAVVPPEQTTNLVYGTFGHLGSPVTYTLAMAWCGVTVANAIGLFILTSIPFILFTLVAEKRHASLELPKPTPREFWDGMVMVFVKGVGIGGGLVAAGWWLHAHVPLWQLLGVRQGLSNSWWLIAVATLGTDLAYYWIHRMLSHSRGQAPLLRYYRKKHSAHHAVTALDFLRGNQSSLVDTAVSQFQPSLIVISWLLGLDLAGTLVAYGLVLLLQATDHTSATYSIGWLNWIFMDNHAHKLHHCKRGHLINHAAAFSFWDRLWGTYYEDWSLSSNYIHHHGLSLPIRRVDRARTSPSQRVDADAAGEAA